MFLRRHRKFIISMIMLSVTLLCGLSGYLIAESEPRIVAHTEEEEEAVQADADNEKIGADTAVTWDYECEMCRHHVYVKTQPDTDMIGLTFSKLKNAYPDVIVVSFSADEVVLKKKLYCYCPKHFILKRNGEKLAVFKTAAGSDSQEIYADTDILFKSIDKDQQTLLENGRVFGSFEEVQKYIDEIKE